MSAVELERYLGELKSCGLGHINPVRLAYLEGLLKRFGQRHNEGNKKILDKACSEIENSTVELSSLRIRAKSQLRWIEVNADGHFESACEHFSTLRFNDLDRLYNRLNSQNGSPPKKAFGVALLAELRERLDNLAQDFREVPSAWSLDEVLESQEREVVDGSKSGSSHDLALSDTDKEQWSELRSLKHFREQTKHNDVDQLIARALRETPTNPGPHNPQMLAMKALLEMRDLSPEYSRCLASYLETMLWLEKSGSKLNKLNKGPA